MGKKNFKLAYGGVLIAVGILLPQVFHVLGESAGMIFLPMELSVLLSGLLLGPMYGGCIGGIVPVLSSILTGMPPVPKLYFVMVEMIGYGVTTGFMRRKYSVWKSLIAGMIVGRGCYLVGVTAAVSLLELPEALGTTFAMQLLSGIPGILLQLLLIPILEKKLKKGGFTIV